MKDMEKKITKEDVVKFIEGMTVLELSELVKELEQKFGVSAAAPVAVAAAGPAGADAAAAAEEKTEFDVILTGFGDQKIQVIKVVRAITGLGLKEAKDLVEGIPKPIKEAISKDEAADIKKKIEEVGGTVDIK
jgi:large subunit ribosomal protein L7/L12